MMCNGYAKALIKYGEFDLAQQLIDIAKAAVEKSHGKLSTNYVGILMSQATLHNAAGEYQMAIDIYHEIESILINHHDPESEYLIDNYVYLAMNYHNIGQFEKAQGEFSEV